MHATLKTYAPIANNFKPRTYALMHKYTLACSHVPQTFIDTHTHMHHRISLRTRTERLGFPGPLIALSKLSAWSAKSLPAGTAKGPSKSFTQC